MKNHGKYDAAWLDERADYFSGLRQEIQDLKDKLSTYSSKADELLSDVASAATSTANLKVSAGRVGVDYIASDEKKKANYDDLVNKKKQEEANLNSAKTKEQKAEIQKL